MLFRSVVQLIHQRADFVLNVVVKTPFGEAAELIGDAHEGLALTRTCALADVRGHQPHFAAELFERYLFFFAPPVSLSVFAYLQVGDNFKVQAYAIILLRGYGLP